MGYKRMKEEKTVRSICRRFILYNDFIPPTKDMHEWPYFTFGYYDGFSFGVDIFRNSKESSFMELWNDSLNEIQHMNEKAEAQIIYGFRDEDKSNNDAMFWKEDNIYPFIFFTMIQFEEEGSRDLTNLYEIKADVEDYYTREREYKGILYLTLENSDILFILKCKSYEQGAKIIDSFHRKTEFYRRGGKKWEIKYSFTVAAIEKKYLRNMELLSDSTFKEKIKYIYIYATAKYSGSIDDYYKKLEKNYQ